MTPAQPRPALDVPPAPRLTLGIGAGPDQYLNTVARDIRQGNADFRRRLTRYRQLRVVVIVSAAAVPVLAAVPEVPRVVLAVLGALAAVAEGVSQLFQFKDAAIRAGQTANALENETNLMMLAQPPYALATRALRFNLYVQRVEKIRLSGASAFLQLWTVEGSTGNAGGGHEGSAQGGDGSVSPGNAADSHETSDAPGPAEPSGSPGPGRQPV